MHAAGESFGASVKPLRKGRRGVVAVGDDARARLD